MWSLGASDQVLMRQTGPKSVLPQYLGLQAGPDLLDITAHHLGPSFDGARARRCLLHSFAITLVSVWVALDLNSSVATTVARIAC